MSEPDDEPEYESPFGTTPDWFGAADADADGRPRRDGSFDPAGATWFTDDHPTPDADDAAEPAGLLDGAETTADDANAAAAAGADAGDEPPASGDEPPAGVDESPAGADEPSSTPDEPTELAATAEPAEEAEEAAPATADTPAPGSPDDEAGESASEGEAGESASEATEAGETTNGTAGSDGRTTATAEAEATGSGDEPAATAATSGRTKAEGRDREREDRDRSMTVVESGERSTVQADETSGGADSSGDGREQWSWHRLVTRLKSLLGLRRD